MSEQAAGQPILVVDDDWDIRDSLLQILRDEGHCVAGAANGDEALFFLRQAQTLPRLILLDIMMPIMDGVQFRSEQRKLAHWLEIPVIAMTAGSREELVAMLEDAELSSGALDGMGYLRKPIDLRTLLHLVLPQ